MWKKIESINSYSFFCCISGVIGNLTSLQTIDLSYNKLHDITTDQEFFRLPKNITEIYLSNNQLHDLPTEHLINADQLSILDVTHNNIDIFQQNLTKLVTNGTEIHFEGKTNQTVKFS